MVLFHLVNFGLVSAACSWLALVELEHMNIMNVVGIIVFFDDIWTMSLAL
jgi:hypothetical protein